MSRTSMRRLRRTPTSCVVSSATLPGSTACCSAWVRTDTSRRSFPGHALLAEERSTVAAITDAPKPPPRRLTLTLPVLTQAERVIVVAYGASKAEAIREAVERDDSALPAALVLRRTKRPLVIVDDAGRQTSEPLTG